MADVKDPLMHMGVSAPIGCGDLEKLRLVAQRTGDAQMMRDIETTERMRRNADMGMGKKSKRKRTKTTRRKKGM